MEIKKVNPFLYFNFVDSSGKMNPLQFVKPIQIIKAHNVEEVITCMKKIQESVKNGYYAAGFISYEAAPAFNEALSVNKGNKMPLLWFGIFKSPLNRELQQETINNIHIDEWKPAVLEDDYNENFDLIQRFIHADMTQQVNYTIPFQSNFSGDPITLYKQLERAQSANYAAYLDIGDFSIVSASPELFFHLKNQNIITKPMKGTIGRRYAYQDDIRQGQLLRNSHKDLMENKLITDLICNELKNIAKANTINIPYKFTIEKYPTLYQMTSTVTAEVEENIEIIDIFKALFPSGSITGMPKEATMDIITRVETSPREVYCGAIGYITPDNEAVFNVPIRTALIDKKSHMAYYGVGGAITKNSKKENEYEEILVKTRLLSKKHNSFKLLESLGLINGKYIVFDEHMKRLKESAEYFDFKLDLDRIQAELLDLSKKHQKSTWKVRLLVEVSGNYLIEIEETTAFTGELKVKLATQPIDKENVFLYHKTTNRSVYKQNQIIDAEVFDTLLWNQEEEITEFTNGNIVVDLNNQLYTPPIQSGLLPGTFRQSLLNDGIITERIISIEELYLCKQIWFINSVRKWVPVKLIQ